MPTVNDDLITNLLLGKDELTPALKKAYAAGKDYAKFTQQMGTANKAFAAGMEETNKKLEEQRTRFDMNTLSWVFGGYALQRMGQSMNRFLIPSMDKLEKINDKASKKVMGVTAAFEFLKISIFETLMNVPLFQKFVEWIIKGAIWIAEFAQKHPAVVAMAEAIGAIAIALGSLAIGIGIFKQLGHLGTLMGIGTNGGIMGAIKGISMGFASWGIPTLLVGALVAVSALAVVAALKFEDTRKIMSELWDKGFAKPSENLISTLGEMVGLDIGLQDSFRFLGVWATWAFSISSIQANILLSVITLVSGAITETAKKFISFAKLFANLGKLFKGDFSTVKEELANLSDTSGMQKVFDRLKENANGIKDAWDIAKKGPIGLYKELEKQKNTNTVINPISEQGIPVGGDVVDNFSSSFDSLSNTVNSKMGSYGINETVISKFSELGQTVQQDTSFSNELGEAIRIASENSVVNISKIGETTSTVMGNSEDKTGVLGGFSSLGDEINLDSNYFDSLKKDIDTWASTVTVKKVRIEYEHVNKGSDNGSGVSSFFSRTGNALTKAMSSITNGAM